MTKNKVTILKRILCLEPIVSVLREVIKSTSVSTEDGITFGKALGTAEVTLESKVDRISARMKILTKKATILKRVLCLEPIVRVLREVVEGTSVGVEDEITFRKSLGTTKVTLESKFDRISAGMKILTKKATTHVYHIS